jgi:hypothetical protein
MASEFPLRPGLLFHWRPSGAFLAGLKRAQFLGIVTSIATDTVTSRLFQCLAPTTSSVYVYQGDLVQQYNDFRRIATPVLASHASGKRLLLHRRVVQVQLEHTAAAPGTVRECNEAGDPPVAAPDDLYSYLLCRHGQQDLRGLSPVSACRGPCWSLQTVFPPITIPVKAATAKRLAVEPLHKPLRTARDYRAAGLPTPFGVPLLRQHDRGVIEVERLHIHVPAAAVNATRQLLRRR